SFILSGPLPQGRRAASRRPACGATSTSDERPRTTTSGGNTLPCLAPAWRTVYTSPMRVVLAFWAALLAASALAADPHVYLVVVDGLGADSVDSAQMPRLFDVSLEPVRLRTEAWAAMPTRTNPNHVTLLTGALPESHGFTGNGYWSRTAGAAPENLESAALLEMETLFTVAESTRPEMITVGAFSKAKLGRVFADVRSRQHAPDVLWVPEEGGLISQLTGVARDAETMDAFLAATAEREPDLAVINLSEVDRTSHQLGPRAAADAIRHADAAIGHLVDDLHARGRWERSVLVVTADHGFDDVAPTDARPEPDVTLSEWFEAAGVPGLHVVGDGGVAHVYADGVAPDAPDLGPATSKLAWAASVAWRAPGVAEVLARLPVPGVSTMAAEHPDWGLTHERAGDLLVVAAPGYQFVEPRDLLTGTFKGNHGSPRERRVPLVIAGGGLGTAAPRIVTPLSSADVGMTIASLLHLRAPRRFDGGAVHAGRPIPLSWEALETGR
ncbi:MAG: alkaline phosphatase family protein, partial [Candidatus Binatia bacterium]